MGRLAIIDKDVENLLLQSSGPWSIGLLVGCVTEQRDYVVHFANTPIEDEEKTKSISSISDILVTSHAGELQRMLPGGLCICGIAAIGTDLSTSHTKLQQIMVATYKKLCSIDLYGSQTDTWQLILVDSLSKKMSSRSLLVSDYKSSLKPAETRVQSLEGGWLIAQTSMAVDKTFYLRQQQQDQHFEQQLLSGLLPYLASITNSLCLCNGTLLDDDFQLGSPDSNKGRKAASQNTESSRVSVQLLGRIHAVSNSSCSEMVSSVWLKGSVSAMVFLRAPATVAQVREAIKSDLKKSISLRCQLLCEDILQVGSEKHTLEDCLIYETPPRVYIPYSSLPVLFNDYMFKDEKAEDCAQRAEQLLGVSHIDASTIDVRVELSAKMKDIEYLCKLRKASRESNGSDVSESGNVIRNIGRIASIASGAALALAVSLNYLNLGKVKIATVACEHCTYYYCSACVKKFHPKVGPLKTHNIIKASSLQSDEAFCNEHNERHCIFCQNCKQLLCLKCVAEHASHDLLNMDIAFIKAKETLHGLSSRLDNHLVAASKIRQETDQRITSLKREARAAEKKIKMECEFLRNAVTGCEKTMIHTVMEDVREKVYSLQHALDEIPKLSTGSMRVLNDLSGVLDKSSITHVLACCHRSTSDESTSFIGNHIHKSTGIAGVLLVENRLPELQLKILDSLNKPTDPHILFDYENFDCTSEINLLADKLSVSTNDPHAFEFLVSYDYDAENEERRHDNSPMELRSPNRHGCGDSGNIIFVDNSPPEKESNKDTTCSEPLSNQGAHREPFPPTFLNRVMCKHPEFLHHSVSLDAVLHQRNETCVEEALRQSESNAEQARLLDVGYADDNNNNAAYEHSKDSSPLCISAQRRLIKLENILNGFGEECRLGKQSSSNASSSLVRQVTSEPIPVTTVGIKQRAKEGYYTRYKLTSERQQDVKSLAKVEKKYNDSLVADPTLISDLNS